MRPITANGNSFHPSTAFRPGYALLLGLDSIRGAVANLDPSG